MKQFNNSDNRNFSKGNDETALIIFNRKSFNNSTEGESGNAQEIHQRYYSMNNKDNTMELSTAEESKPYQSDMLDTSISKEHSLLHENIPNELCFNAGDKININDTNVPIVMLLGWAGCQDRYLMKYSKIYEDRGLMTIRYTAPVNTLFWRRSEMKPIGEKILKLFYDLNFHSHPVIFHIFSNGGAYLYQHISLAMQKHKAPLQIRGMIIDSAPGERRLLGLYRAVTAIYGRERKPCYRLTAIVITLTLGVMWFLEEVYTSFKSLFVKTEPIQTNPFNDLKNEPNDFPQLFLYSKGDLVIPYTDIEKFISLRQQQGVNVSSICFEDAEHVKIFTKYPSQYIRSVCTFVNNCLKEPFWPVTFDNTTITRTKTTESKELNSVESFDSQGF